MYVCENGNKPKIAKRKNDVLYADCAVYFQTLISADRLFSRWLRSTFTIVYKTQKIGFFFCGKITIFCK